jgi:regulator of sigma E protease
MTLVYICVAVAALLFMITVHELGHYMAAKALGFRVNEFAVGFGKPLFKHVSKKTGEVFSIRLVPLGGYCAFEGEGSAGSPGAEAAAEPNPFTRTKSGLVGRTGTPYNETKPWQRLIVLFAGVFMNFVCGVIFAFILLVAVGYNNTVTITKINENSPIYATEIKEGDVITAVNGTKMSYLNGFTALVGKYGLGDEFTLSVRGKGDILVSKDFYYAGPDATEKTIALGIEEGIIEYEKMSAGPAVGKAFEFSFELAWLVLSFLGKMVVGQVSIDEMGGTLSTISVMSQAVSAGLINLLILIPLISINLAVFNLLPVPALDGARMVFVLIEWIRGKPVNPELENRIHMIGLLALLGFVILLDFNYLVIQKLLH